MGAPFRVAGFVVALSASLHGCGPTRAKVPAAGALPELRRVPLGLCEDYPEESRSLAEARRDFELLETAGVSVLRVSIGWDGIEPEKDRYDFAFWDAFVDLAVREFGLTLVPYVAYTPQWDSDGSPEDFWKTPPRDSSEYGEIMRLLAERYRGRIASWEIWNEPDNRDYWLGTAAEYAALLEVGSRAVRAADPRAKVVFGGLAGGVEFLREVFDEHQGAERVDVVNLHSYYETWNPNPVETIPEYLDEVGTILQRHGGRQSVWMAEVGYSNFKTPSATGVSPGFSYEHGLDFQAVMLVRTLALVLSQPSVSLVAWYELKDPRDSDQVIGDAHNRHLGVTFADYRPKPAFQALSFTNRLFAAGFRAIDAELSVSGASASDIELHGYLTARRTLVLIAWIRTHPPSASASAAQGESDERHARLHVALPFTSRGRASAYDERGRPLATPVGVRSKGAQSELAFELHAGQVQVIELPVTVR